MVDQRPNQIKYRYLTRTVNYVHQYQVQIKKWWGWKTIKDRNGADIFHAIGVCERVLEDYCDNSKKDKVTPWKVQTNGWRMK